MYADDIVLLFKSAKGKQTLLCRLEDFCNKLNLKVNINKTNLNFQLSRQSPEGLQLHLWKYLVGTCK